jgi:hypothetical protein
VFVSLYACVYLCAFVQLYGCVQLCARASVPVRDYIRAGVRGYVCMYVRDGGYMRVCVHTCAFVCVSVCMRVGVRICACVCAYMCACV